MNLLGLDEADLRTALLGADVLRQAKAIGHAERERFTELANKLRLLLSVVGRGPLVYRLTLPLETRLARPPKRDGSERADVTVKLCPRLNEYAAMAPWTLKLARAELDRLIEQAKDRFPFWDCGSVRRVTIEPVRRRGRVVKVPKLHVTGGQRRIIVVERHSSREIDELAVDVLGGKLVVDRLIWAGVLAGDSRRHLGRVPRWMPAKPGHGRLEIAVYEVDQPSRHHHSLERATEDAAPRRWS